LRGSASTGDLGTSRNRAQKLVQHLVFLEPGLHCHPGVLCCVRAKTLPVIGEETMARARIDLELRGLLAHDEYPRTT
jgi:hypothetical protein